MVVPHPTLLPLENFTVFHPAGLSSPLEHQAGTSRVIVRLHMQIPAVSSCKTVLGLMSTSVEGKRLSKGVNPREGLPQICPVSASCHAVFLFLNNSRLRRKPCWRYLAEHPERSVGERWLCSLGKAKAAGQNTVSKVTPRRMVSWKLFYRESIEPLFWSLF